MSSTTPLRRGLTATVLGMGLLLSACGSGEGSAPASPEAAAAGEAAEANQAALQLSDDLRDIEVLDVADGSISTLRAAVDGDRPVLVWCYAPH